MAKTKISEFSATPANNTDIDSINISEGCAPSGINDAIRELMAQLKDFQTGAVGDSFNGPIGTSTAAAGAFTTLSATGAITSTLATGTAPLVIASTTKVANLNVDLLDGADWASPAALGSTTPAAVSATTLSASSTVTLSGGTANGVAYLNGSKVVTSGSALTFNGTAFINKPTSDSNPVVARFGVINSAATDDAYLDISADAANNLVTLDSTGSNTGSLAFKLGGSEQMRMTSTGLGIGTSSPGAKLEVNVPGTTGTSSALRLSRGSGYGTTEFKQYYTSGTDYGLTIGNTVSDYLTLNLSSGNLGLGVTPSAWSTAQRAIQLASNGSVAGSATYPISLSSNAVATSNGWAANYIADGFATLYAHSAGQHRWFTAPSGTAGNAITFTQAMTLNASGNLGIGTSSPSASAILDAQSTTKGVRMPNMTTTQKNAIASPAAGLMVFDTTLAKLCVYSGAAWETITSV